LNQTTIPDGVLVSLSVTLPVGASGQQFPLHLSGAGGSDKGRSTQFATVDGVLTVGTNPPNTASGPVSILPHLVAGGSFVTCLYVVNTADRPAAFSVAFFDDYGRPLNMPLDASHSSAVLADTITASGAKY
jgi:hypothetical protein